MFDRPCIGEGPPSAVPRACQMLWAARGPMAVAHTAHLCTNKAHCSHSHKACTIALKLGCRYFPESSWARPSHLAQGVRQYHACTHAAQRHGRLHRFGQVG
jgi:hypothetical protein